MSMFTRRSFLGAAGATTALTAACGNGVGTNAAMEIDARVDASRDYLFNEFPEMQDIDGKALGTLWMPLVTKAGLFVGGAYGEGALRINNATVDYYSATQGSFGLQVGAQQYAHALFFITEEALGDFRRSAGWSAGADLEYAIKDKGGNLTAETITSLDPVIAVVFGQAGLLVGASLEGTKYTRIIP